MKYGVEPSSRYFGQFTAQPQVAPVRMLYIAIGIWGDVMPHNLYLHSSIVQTRAFVRDEKASHGVRFAALIQPRLCCARFYQCRDLNFGGPRLFTGLPIKCRGHQ